MPLQRDLATILLQSSALKAVHFRKHRLEMCRTELQQIDSILSEATLPANI